MHALVVLDQIYCIRIFYETLYNVLGNISLTFSSIKRKMSRYPSSTIGGLLPLIIDDESTYVALKDGRFALRSAQVLYSFLQLGACIVQEGPFNDIIAHFMLDRFHYGQWSYQS